MEISKKQLEFTLSNAKITIAEGPVRAGKSFSFVLKMLEVLGSSTEPKGDILISGRTARTVERNLLNGEFGLFGLLGLDNYTYNRASGEVKVEDRTLWVVGANDDKSFTKIQGASFSHCFLDEVVLLPQSYVYQTMARQIPQGTKHYWNCNPDGPNHYIKKEFIDNKKLKESGHIQIVKFSMDDNPALSEEVKSDLKKLYTGTVFEARYIYGLWQKAEGLIYPSFSTSRHILRPNEMPPIDKYKSLVVGIDIGFQNPTAFALIGEYKGKEYKEGFYLIKEYYHNGRESTKQKTAEEYSRDLKKFIGDLKVNAVYIDPSATGTILQFRKDGIPNLKKANNEVLAGIQTVASKIGNDLFYVNANCKYFLEEIAAYSWKENKNGDKEQPIKEQDHLQDSVRYALHTHWGKVNSISTLSRKALGL